jgi:hypothetical protein
MLTIPLPAALTKPGTSMTTYFAFKLADATQQGIDELLKNLDAGSTVPQHELHTRVSIEVTDAILKNAVEELIQRFQAGAEGAGILTTLLSMLKSTAHMLVRQMLGKHDNKEVAKMAEYLRSRRVEINGEILYGFAMTDDLAQKFNRIFAAIAAGDGKAQKPELQETMLNFSEQALVVFFDDFVSPMGLGFVKRKMSDLGRGTIHSGIQMALKKLIPQLGQKELEVMAEYYGGLFVSA